MVRTSSRMGQIASRGGLYGPLWNRWWLKSLEDPRPQLTEFSWSAHEADPRSWQHGLQQSSSTIGMGRQYYGLGGHHRRPKWSYKVTWSVTLIKFSSIGCSICPEHLHRIRVAINLLRQQGIRALPWPIKSPDMLPIEHILGVFGGRVHNRPKRFNNSQQLSDRAKGYQEK